MQHAAEATRQEQEDTIVAVFVSSPPEDQRGLARELDVGQVRAIWNFLGSSPQQQAAFHGMLSYTQQEDLRNGLQVEEQARAAAKSRAHSGVSWDAAAAPNHWDGGQYESFYSAAGEYTGGGEYTSPVAVAQSDGNGYDAAGNGYAAASNGYDAAGYQGYGATTAQGHEASSYSMPAAHGTAAAAPTASHAAPAAAAATAADSQYGSFYDNGADHSTSFYAAAGDSAQASSGGAATSAAAADGTADAENQYLFYNDGAAVTEEGEAAYGQEETGLKYAGDGEEAAKESEYYLNAHGYLCYLDDEGFERMVEGADEDVGQYEAWQYGFYNDDGEWHYYAEVWRVCAIWH